MAPSPQPNWHQLETEAVVQLLETDLQHGLSAAEAQRRQERFGPNQLTPARHTSAWKKFLLQFHQPLLYILLAATGVTLFLHEWVDAAVIFGVVFINALVGYLQETKAEKAIAALAQMVVTEATVRRDGRKRRVRSAELVPGDVVLLQSGDRVPADLRLLRVRNLQVDESALTGESVPVMKHSDPVALETLLAERKNLAYAGTLVTAGQGDGVVWAIGDHTETGRIAWLISEVVELSTPLTRKIAHFSRLLLWAILALAALTFGLGLWRGGSIVEMFMASVALAVAAIPEGLPAALTVTLAIGVARMARRRAIIRKLPAVETLGSTTVICSDKTGTLTENQMTVREIFAGGEWFEVTGTGYEPSGEIRRRGANTAAVPVSNAALGECLKAGWLCNDSQLVREHGHWVVQGDPTEAALIVAAQKGGLLEPELMKLHPRVDSIPFESEYQYMATLHGIAEQAGEVIYKKGAVERLLDKCRFQLLPDGELAPLESEKIRGAAEAMASQGLRVLALARRRMPSRPGRLEHHHVARELVFLGLQGMMDPPRAEAMAAVRKCQDAGIKVKMITGDHLLTAQAIAHQIGLHAGLESAGAKSRLKAGPAAIPAITGRELEGLSDERLQETAERATVFARVAPEQKLRLVQALQARGQVVAMTGDGVNDAPALKQADIGVAMGINGTEVAKGAADIILTDDNFASIEAAVEEGRGVFDNLTKFIVWTLPTNGGESLVLLAAILTGIALPALPVQMLWINMTTALLLGLMLVFEPKEAHLMHRPPRDPKVPILTLPLLMRTGLVTLIMLAGALGLFVWELSVGGASLAEARTVVVNVIVMTELFYLLNCRSLTRSMLAVGFFSNRLLWFGVGGMLLAQLLFTYAPFMNRLFHTAPIGGEAWLRILAVGLTAYTLVGLEKWIRFHLAQGRGKTRDADLNL